MASRGKFADGHAALVYGLRRAKILMRGGLAGPELPRRYEVEILAYCRRWGVFLESPTGSP